MYKEVVGGKMKFSDAVDHRPVIYHFLNKLGFWNTLKVYSEY